MAVPSTIASLDEMPPGITDLSLREALVIAANHPGPDRIEFGSWQFPASAPVAIDVTSVLELRDGETTIDGTRGGVVIAAAPAYTGPLLRIGAEAADARLIGFELRGGAMPAIEIVAGLRVELAELAFVPTMGAGVRIENSRTVVVRDTSIDGAAGNAIEIDRGTDVTVERTTITRTLGDPIFAQSSTTLVVRDNTILIEPGSTGRGVVFASVTGSQVLDNFIDPGAAQLVRLVDSNDNEIVGNILDRGDVGVALFGTSTRNLVFRNVIVSNPEPLYVAATATGNRLVHNTIYMCGGIVDGAPDSELTSNLEADQGFVDPDAFDFHLAPGSAAIDAATDLGLDLLPDDPARFLGAAPDLGAVETR